MSQYINRNGQKQNKDQFYSHYRQRIKNLQQFPTNTDINSNTHDLGAKGQQIERLFNNNQYQRAYQLLEQLIMILDDYMDCSEYSPTKQKNSNKNYLLFLCYYNISVCLEKQKRLSFALKYIEEASAYLQAAIMGQIKNQNTIFFKVENIKLLLQQCSLISQLGDHKGAAYCGEKVIQQLLIIFRDYLFLLRTLLNTMNYKKRIKSSSLIDFRITILKEAEEKLSFLSSLTTPRQLINKSSEQLKGKANKLYTWKENQGNNQKYIRNTLQIDSTAQNANRNILGISQASSWVQEFNIGDFMSLKPKSFESANMVNSRRAQSQNTSFFLLSSDKILQLCILTSIAYFVISTETRLKLTKILPKKMHESLKFLNMQKNQEFLSCRLLHLKAIQLAGKFLPITNKYLKHLISSFNKNYKFFMQNITEQQSINPSKIIEETQKYLQDKTQSRNSPAQNSLSKLNYFKRKRNPSLQNSQTRRLRNIHHKSEKTRNLSTESHVN